MLFLREFYLKPRLFYHSTSRTSPSSQGGECGGPCHSGVATTKASSLAGPPDVCKPRMILLKAEVLGWKDHSSLFLDNFSTLDQELQPAACGAAVSTAKPTFKQANCGFAFWVVYHHIFDVIFSLGGIIFFKQMSWLPPWLWDVAVWATWASLINAGSSLFFSFHFFFSFLKTFSWTVKVTYGYTCKHKTTNRVLGSSLKHLKLKWRSGSVAAAQFSVFSV